MLIFITGLSKVGKTSLAQEVAKKIPVVGVISGSEWVRARFVPDRDLSPQEYLAAITEYSQVQLRENPDVCVDFIRSRYDLDNCDYIIEGLRNPRDFALLFRPDRDVAVFVHSDQCVLAPTEFEKGGVAAIAQYVTWHVQTGITPASRRLNYALATLAGPVFADNLRAQIGGPPEATRCWNLEELTNRLVFDARVLLAAPSSDARANSLVHAPIPPLRVCVEKRLLHNEDPQQAGWVPAHLFAISSYTGHAPTFQARLDDGSVFSYVPPHRIRVGPTPPQQALDSTDRLDLVDLVYANAPSERLVAHRYEALAAYPVRAYFARRGLWLDAVYLFTVDWYTENLLLHGLALKDGQLALLPSHKVLFDAPADELPPYLKLRAEFRVRDESPLASAGQGSLTVGAAAGPPALGGISFGTSTGPFEPVQWVGEVAYRNSIRPHRAAAPTPEVVADLASLAKLCFKFARVERATRHEDGQRPETDSDHTVMLAVIACACAARYAPHLDVGKVAQFASVHDLVEADAGDVFSLGMSEETRLSKEAAERAALGRIRTSFANLPWVAETIAEYEKLASDEARFVKIMDKVMPKLTHLLNGSAMLYARGLDPVAIRDDYRALRDTMISKYPQAEALAIFDLVVAACTSLWGLTST